MSWFSQGHWESCPGKDWGKVLLEEATAGLGLSRGLVNTEKALAAVQEVGGSGEREVTGLRDF